MSNVSLWEEEHFTKHDVIIVGGGLSGLSTGISLLEKTYSYQSGLFGDSKLKIAILERGFMPSGASSKNAGLTVHTEFTEFLDDIKNMGEKKAVQIVIDRFRGIQKLLSRLQKIHGSSETNNPNLNQLNIENETKFNKITKIKKFEFYKQTEHLKLNEIYQQEGFFEIISENEMKSLEQLEYANSLLRPYFKEDIFILRNELIKRNRFNPNYVKSIVEVKYCGSLDSGNILKSLMRYFSFLGGLYFINVTYENHSFNEIPNSKRFKLKAKLGQDNQVLSEINLFCNKIAFCTNAFTKNIFKNEKIVPGRGQIIVTKPLKGVNFSGTFGFEEGYFYFRTISENRILIGGGRNYFLKEEESFEFKNTDKILNVILKKITEIFGNNIGKFEIDKHWSGIMAFSSEPDSYKIPIIKEVSSGIFICARLAGMGISLSSQAGERLANKILKTHSKQKL